ncbi:hypothetical protein PFICI_14843 [Pestalotiopsis fici W106-1]|uniref:Uncharacterized protein n=1 Tax=Pestalotiopsis fici (strain W106-1 / CGMCC3.15140) TaxID=1229662 RepID=W3WH88_PESFW|nr:uncharacterized protein PFICI_14843 [Pestalotiopsis fici W106-1]ETS73238.1 hypothetical protein PFICI_14843 [Pestalotiopsis fici W106-1]
MPLPYKSFGMQPPVEKSKLDQSLDEISGRNEKFMKDRGIVRKRRQQDLEDDDDDVEEIVRDDGPAASREIAKRPRIEAVNHSDVVRITRGGQPRAMFLKHDPMAMDWETHGPLAMEASASTGENVVKQVAGAIERNKAMHNGVFQPMMTYTRVITKYDRRQREKLLEQGGPSAEEVLRERRARLLQAEEQGSQRAPEPVAQRPAHGNGHGQTGRQNSGSGQRSGGRSNSRPANMGAKRQLPAVPQSQSRWAKPVVSKEDLDADMDDWRQAAGLDTPTDSRRPDDGSLDYEQ